jgi:hypothetical protein
MEQNTKYQFILYSEKSRNYNQKFLQGHLL